MVCSASTRGTIVSKFVRNILVRYKILMQKLYKTVKTYGLPKTASIFLICFEEFLNYDRSRLGNILQCEITRSSIIAFTHLFDVSILCRYGRAQERLRIFLADLIRNFLSLDAFYRRTVFSLVSNLGQKFVVPASIT